MGRRKPMTHTVEIHRMGRGEVVKCRLTKRHLITENMVFNRNTRAQVGGGFTPWRFSPGTIEEIQEEG